VWQRGTSFTKPNFVYTADRWKVTQIFDDKVRVFRSPEVPNKQSLYSLRVEATESNSGAGAATDISQPIEHYQLFRGKTVTFSGYVYCDPGASFVPNIDDGIANTAGATYTASAWTRFSVTKPIGESATALLPYGRFHRSGLAPGKGIYLSQLQLHVGDVPLPYQPKSVDEEYRDCLRYFEVVDFSFGIPAIANGSTVAYSSIRYAKKRAVPTVVLSYDGVNGVLRWDVVGVSSETVSSGASLVTDEGCQIYTFWATTERNWVAGHAFVDAEL